MGERFKLFGCVISLIMRDNKILMILRKNKPDAGNYNLVGGRMEEGETVKQAIIREAKEEVGLVLKEEDIEIVSSLHRICEGGYNSIEYVLVVKNFEGEPQNLEPFVCEKLVWWDLDNLPENISLPLPSSVHQTKRELK